MHIYQKAVLFYDPLGRAGKGVMLKIIGAFFPRNFTSSISPFLWKEEFYLAALAGKKLNIVGELPKKQPIPAEIFKAVIGQDSIEGRHPSGRPFNYVNAAAHIFNSNYLIKTDDYAEGFYDRWLILLFPNSLVRTKKKPDVNLANNLIKSELAGIAHWALEGAIRRLSQDCFSTSVVHDEIMARWRIYENPLLGFINDCCKVGDQSYTVRRSTFNEAYIKWCKEFNLPYFTKQEVKDLILSNGSLDVQCKLRDGNETFIGLTLKDFVNDLESTITEL